MIQDQDLKLLLRMILMIFKVIWDLKMILKKIKKEKMLEVQYPDSDSDSDSSVELPSSKKKKKSKNPTIIIKNYTLPQRERKNEFDASEQIAKLKDIYKEPEPVPQQVRLGYFV